MKNEVALHKNKGDLLLLEDRDGKAEYFFRDDVKKLISNSYEKSEVVFVSSCYSQKTGEVFLEAGAKHVICIMAGEKISDKASI